jgi:hypothetical protein
MHLLSGKGKVFTPKELDRIKALIAQIDKIFI